MIKNDMEQFMQKAMVSLQDAPAPGENHKEAVLKRVLAMEKEKTAVDRFKGFVLVYPWRFALGVAALQNIVCTLVFGSAYTNLIMHLMGR